MTYTADVAVVGGGIIGSALTYYLSRLGVDVILLEAGELGSGTSSACDGCIILQSKSPGPHLELAIESAALYRTLTEELDTDIEYSPCGSLMVIERQDELAPMKALMGQQLAIGLDVRLLSGPETRELEPAVAAHVAGAAWCPGDAQINPLLAVQGFARAARRQGARIVERAAVTQVERSGRTVRKIVSEAGSVRAGAFVLCTGAFTPKLLDPLGLMAPIIPRRGQLAVIEAAPRLIRNVLLCARYIAAKHHPELLEGAEDAALRLGVGLALEQTAAGSLLVGSTREFVGYDTSTSLEAIRTILDHATRLVPALGGLNIIRTFSGLRPYTPDGLPYLGRFGQTDNLFIAAGHEGDGIALAPATGQLMADLVATGRSADILSVFSPDRCIDKKVGDAQII